LAVFTNVTLATKLWIKGKNFSLANLFQDEQMAKEFEGGSIGIFRLAPQDYHRFHAHQAGKFVVFKKITGKYYTVNPLAVKERIDVFTENVRTVHVLETPLADRVVRSVFVAIGALLVGSIVHTGIKEAGSTVKKGQELGWFAYGGSTCICVWPSGTIEFDKDLVDASLKGMETHVYVGESIGRLI
jgi:phosphatidylserine decarboxylase